MRWTNHTVSRNMKQKGVPRVYTSSLKNMRIYLLYFWFWLPLIPFVIIYNVSLPLDSLMLFTTGSLILTTLFILYQKFFGIQRLLFSKNEFIVDRANRSISFIDDEISHVVLYSPYRIPYQSYTIHLKNNSEYAISHIGFSGDNIGEIGMELERFSS